MDRKRMADQIKGKRVLVTGATDGIGRQTVLELAKMGAKILVHGRNPKKGRSVLSEIRERTGTEPDLLQADFASLSEVRTLAEEIQEKYDRLDVILESSFSGYDAYSRSKLCVNLFTFRLAEKLKGTGVTANCLHPGVISTKLLHAFGISGGASVEKGAGNLIHAAASPDLENVTGKYFVDREETEPASISFDQEVQDRLWRLSEEHTEEFLNPRSR